MSKKLSQTERIKRHLLRKGIDYPADKVVAELAATGCETTAQLVYNVRSNMKSSANVNGEPVKPLVGHTPKAKNAQTMGATIIEILKENFAAKKGYLSVKELVELVKKSGYNSNAQHFSHSVRMECYRLSRKNEITEHRNGDSVLYGPVVSATAVQEQPKSIEPATTLGIDAANINDLLSVQKLVSQIGGADRLLQHVKLLQELETKPAAELLETLAGKMTPTGAN